MSIPYPAQPTLGGQFAIGYLIDAANGLQDEVDVHLRLWLLLAEELRTHFGNAGMSESIRRILDADESHKRNDFALQIDGLLKSDEPAKAARLIREWAGVTWDQAHDLAAHWREIPNERKQAWMRFMQIKQALDQISSVKK